MTGRYLKFTFILLNLFIASTVLYGDIMRIMPLGDSITYDDTLADHEGTPRPSSIRTGYRNHLYYQLTDAGYEVNFVGSRVAGEKVTPSFDPHNEGHPGWTSYEIGNNVYRYLSQNPADTVLLHIGTNDNDTSPAGVNDILDEIDYYEENTGRFVRVIVALIIDRESQEDLIIAGFNHNLDNLLKRRISHGDAITIVDMYRGADMAPSDYTDHTHPSDAGYQKIAKVWYDALIAPYNMSLHSFPYSIVDRSNIQSLSVDEESSTISFIAQLPDSGITF